MNAVIENVELSGPAKRIAVQAIENVHLAYFQKGGIRETAETLTKQVESASKHVYTLALHAAKQHPESIEDAARMYVDMCEYAETEYKREHEVDNLREALPTWATYKSNVLRGLRLGLDPRESKSEKQYRSKAMEQISRSRAEKPEHTAIEGGTGPPAMKTEAEVAEFVASTMVPETLRQLLAQVVYAAEVVKAKSIEQAEEILREAWQKLGALSDKRKMRVQP